MITKSKPPDRLGERCIDTDKGSHRKETKREECAPKRLVARVLMPTTEEEKIEEQ